MLLEGWLDKRGRLNTAWRRRHFVLRADGFLHYYATKNSASGGDEEVQQSAPFFRGIQCLCPRLSKQRAISIFSSHASKARSERC